jgi:hypothetical protein
MPKQTNHQDSNHRYSTKRPDDPINPHNRYQPAWPTGIGSNIPHLSRPRKPCCTPPFHQHPLQCQRCHNHQERSHRPSRPTYNHNNLWETHLETPTQPIAEPHGAKPSHQPTAPSNLPHMQPTKSSNLPLWQNSSSFSTPHASAQQQTPGSK